MNFMSVQSKFSWDGIGCVGERKVWTKTLIVERLVGEGCWLGFCLLPLPSSPEWRKLEKA